MVDTSTVVGNIALYDVQGALSDERVRVLVNSMITLNIYDTIKRKTTLAHRTPPTQHTYAYRAIQYDSIPTFGQQRQHNIFHGTYHLCIKAFNTFPKRRYHFFVPCYMVQFQLLHHLWDDGVV